MLSGSEEETVVGDVERAYAARAGEYTALFGRIEQTAQQDRDYVRAWGTSVSGPIIDVGCGPGQWTSFLHECGATVVGVDPVAEFIEQAQSCYPAQSYRVGSAEDLDVSDASLAGILAWYSLIHVTPALIDDVFDEFSRALQPGGSVLLAFFDGVPGEPFEHAVVTAYFWSVAALTTKLEALGFRVVDAVTRTDVGTRPHAALVAVKAQ